MNKKTKIIAEVGFNHAGDIDVGAKMIEAVAESGADMVKFQTYKASDIASPTAPHYEAIKCGEMTLEQHETLAKVAKSCGIEFLSTPFSEWAIELLEKVGVNAYKVSSMDCNNKHLLRILAQTGKPLYVSTGMSTIAEITETLEFLKTEKSGSVTLFHCLSLYPAEAKDLNLTIIPFMKKTFGVPVGYSDHYPGIKACLAAAFKGAVIIEKHFTLDTTLEGGDHYHSADPEMLAQLVSEIELFELMSGDGDVINNRPDRKFASLYRRGVYAARDLQEGDTITKEDILFCRPVSEFTPNDFQLIEGKVLSKEIREYMPIRKKFFK